MKLGVEVKKGIVVVLVWLWMWGWTVDGLIRLWADGPWRFGRGEKGRLTYDEIGEDVVGFK